MTAAGFGIFVSAEGKGDARHSLRSFSQCATIESSHLHLFVRILALSGKWRNQAQLLPQWKLCDSTGGILLSILWMSSFLRPQFEGSSRCCENGFFTEEGATCDRFHRTMYKLIKDHPT